MLGVLHLMVESKLPPRDQAAIVDQISIAIAEAAPQVRQMKVEHPAFTEFGIWAMKHYTSSRNHRVMQWAITRRHYFPIGPKLSLVSKLAYQARE